MRISKVNKLNKNKQNISCHLLINLDGELEVPLFTLEVLVLMVST